MRYLMGWEHWFSFGGCSYQEVSKFCVGNFLCYCHKFSCFTLEVVVADGTALVWCALGEHCFGLSSDVLSLSREGIGSLRFLMWLLFVTSRSKQTKLSQKVNQGAASRLLGRAFSTTDTITALLRQRLAESVLNERELPPGHLKGLGSPPGICSRRNWLSCLSCCLNGKHTPALKGDEPAGLSRRILVSAHPACKPGETSVEPGNRVSGLVVIPHAHKRSASYALTYLVPA
jgi:hypothetical protein